MYTSQVTCSWSELKEFAAPSGKSMFLSCHSEHEWETAPRNAPLSSYQQHWGRRTGSLSSRSSVQNLRVGGVGVGGHCPADPQLGWEASSPTHQTLHFLICLGHASFLSAINLQHHTPIFIPSPSPLVLLALGRFTLGLITVHCCIHATNNGSLGLFSATLYQVWWVSCWPSHYYASDVQQCSPLQSDLPGPTHT